MGFEVSLRGPTNPPAVVVPPSASDYDSVIMDACVVLASTDCTFGIGGFGTATWPVDTGYGLSMFVEQLPEAIQAIAGRETAVIDLYGQGLERTLHFEDAGPEIRIRCVSGTSWKPEPDVEIAGRDDLLRMLTGVAREFAAALSVIWPDVDAVEPVREMLAAGRWDPHLAEG